MKNDPFITKKVNEILNEKEYTDPLNKVMACCWLGAHYKGNELKVLDVQQQTPLSDYFLLMSVANITQGLALADELLYQMKKTSQVLISKEGNQESDWILLDFGDFVIHIFLETARSIYDLDSLWNKSKTIDIPQEYYMSEQITINKNDNLKDYF